MEQQLAVRSPEDYCLRQILKMCRYLQIVRSIEILQMSCDFYIDVNDQIWFFFAKDISYRLTPKSTKELQVINKLKQDRDDKLRQEKADRVLRKAENLLKKTNL